MFKMLVVACLAVVATVGLAEAGLITALPVLATAPSRSLDALGLAGAFAIGFAANEAYHRRDEIKQFLSFLD